MKNNGIPIYKVTVPITSHELTISVRGDFHYGIDGIDMNEGIKTFKKEQNQYRNNMFVIYTGDLIENNLNSSVGHGYDIKIRDPHIQKEIVKDALINVSKNLYGDVQFKKVSDKNQCYLAAGVIGNHEYRSRKTAGQWLQKEIYEPAKILDMGMNGILELNIVNKRLNLSKVCKIFISHSPTTSSGTSIESIIRSCKRKKADVPADVYVYGHYHRRLIQSDTAYDENGNFKKVLYVVNPSPIHYVEYAQWAGYSHLGANWSCNFHIPLNDFAWGKV